VHLVVDGSGADAASADQILKLLPDIIKLDRNLIDGIIHPDPAQTPAAEVIELAK
jgi:EAL domain-containing protein (putative c-di-GMP-specific phosphodiesterase class I)